MPRHIIVLIASLGLAASGCFSFGNDDDPDPTPWQPTTASGGGGPSTPNTGPTTSDPLRPIPATAVPEALTACVRDVAQLQTARLLRHSVDLALGELIACGRAQSALAQAMIAEVIVRNPDAFGMAPDTVEDMEWVADALFGDRDFTFRPSGVWAMSPPRGAGRLDFGVTFVDPASGDAVVHDVFDLESYLVGVRVESAFTHEEMLEDWNTRNVYTFHYDAPGPLAHLLAGDAPLPNPLVVEASLWNFIELVIGPGDENRADWGGFEALVDVEMRSSVFNHAVYDTDAIDVAYQFAAPGKAVERVATERTLDFELRSLGATGLGVAALVFGGAVEVDADRLGGTLTYEIRGEDLAVAVTRDYDVRSAIWRCVGDGGSGWREPRPTPPLAPRFSGD